jgi:hypothetical protein
MTEKLKNTLRTIFYAYFFLVILAVLAFVLFEGIGVSEVLTGTDKEDVLVDRNLHGEKDKKYVVPTSTNYLYGEELLTRVQAGGLVVYFRHFTTDYSGVIKKDVTRPRHLEISAEALQASCDIQRPLAVYGEWQARMVNLGIAANDIPVGRVLSSPYCRVYKGTTIAFGKAPEMTLDLIYRTEEYSREVMSKHIVSMLGEKPLIGNTFIAAHRTQMDDMGSISEGEAFIFEPLGGGEFNLIGRVFPSEWFLSSKEPFAFGATMRQKNIHSKSANKDVPKTPQL